MNELKKEDLIFTDTAEDIKNNDAILGTLEGPCADFVDSTRNGRHYSEELWEKTFSDPIITELIENGGIVGELDHPTDREETDSSRIAIIMRDKPTKKNGKLWAKFDILNTPLGKIAYTLAKAGFKLGISSRGSGDVTPNYDGTEEVDPTSYDFKAFDLVLLPAVKSARLNLVTESLDTKKFNYRKALLESLENANEKERKIMQETLNNLNIKLDENVQSIESAMDILRDYLEVWYNKNIASEKTTDAEKAGWTDEVNDAWVLLTNLVTRLKQDESLDNINDEDSEELAVDDTKAEFEELQEALKENNELANTITSLQEKLSVSYAKEAELQEEVSKYSKSIRRLTNDARQLPSLKAKISSLNEELNSVQDQLSKKDIALKQARNNSLKVFENNKILNEKYSDEQSQVTKLSHKLTSLTESYENEKKELNENIADLKNTIEIKNKEYSQKLQKSNTLVEKYKKIASKAVDKYIDSQALMLGITKNEIKNRLSESYSFDEIDAVCEDLKEYKLNISKLPFRTTNLNENIQMKITPSKNETILPANSFGDEVDEQLMNLAGLK